MDVMDVVGLISRWAHILAAMAAVGGTVFARFVVLPSLAALPEGQRTELHAAMRARWSKIVMASIGFLLISGLYNYMIIWQANALPRWYHPLFGVKFLLGLAIFMIASLLAGRTAAAERFRLNARMWMNLNLCMAVILVCISGVLRTTHNQGPSKQQPSQPAVQTG